MKKLLLITDAWAPQVNGVATVFERIIPHLEKKDISVTVVHPGMFHSFPFPFYPEISMTLFANKKMQKIFQEVAPDYVHIATEWTLGLSARTIAKKSNRAFTTSYHTNFSQYLPHYIFGGSLLSIFSRYYMRWFHKDSSAVMVSNETLKKELESDGFKDVVLWSPGIDTEFFKVNEKARSESPYTSPVFVYFGRIAKEKNIEAFLKCDVPGTKLVIGDGPERKKLERKYKDTSTFVGYKRGKELVDLLSISDVFVFPSQTETFGLVVLEALSCNLPVAAYKVMGPQDVIEEGVDGYLGKNLEESARKCLTLDRVRCREKALQYSWDHSSDLFKANIEAYVKPRFSSELFTRRVKRLLLSLKN